MDTLVCRVELDKNRGLILTVVNKEGKITQKAVLDGQSITLTSKGQDDVSSIVQKPDSIAIKCKNFSLESDTITCTSTKDTLHKSKQKFDIQSTQDMTLKSEAKYSAAASADASVSGRKVAVSALDKVEISGTNATLSAKSKTEVKGTTLSLSGTTQAEMKGLSVDISATGTMKVKGAMTTVKGTLTKVG
jgi:hypothetical protein